MTETMVKTTKLFGGNRNVYSFLVGGALTTTMVGVVMLLWGHKHIETGPLASVGMMLMVVLGATVVILHNVRGEDIDRVTRSLNDMQQSIGSMQQSIGSMQQSIDNISHYLKIEVQPFLAEVKPLLRDLTHTRAELHKKRSPLKLTDKGQSISDRLNAKSIARKHIAQVESKIKKGDTAYHIQEMCFNFAADDLPGLLNDEEHKQLQEIAYDYGIVIEAVIHRVVGIEMRDLVLNKCAKSVSRTNKG